MNKCSIRSGVAVSRFPPVGTRSAPAYRAAEKPLRGRSGFLKCAEIIWLCAVRHLARAVECRWIGPAGGTRNGGALDVVERHRRGKRRQVFGAHLGRCFEARRELDQRGLAEGGTEKAHAERHAKDYAGRHLDDRIAGPGG